MVLVSLPSYDYVGLADALHVYNLICFEAVGFMVRRILIFVASFAFRYFSCS